MKQISHALLVALKVNNEQPAYKIAEKAGLSQSQLSQIINGICPIKENDGRVVSIGRALGLKPEECFE